ncbi:TPA: gamma-glutamyl-gamma-aminobutyrate hydrolase family protein [Klebsiella pneumoniae]|nr:gamma-glutamyl-gamma-aminobutyrate hydrolase family protein [Klebsiella pneumoniae]
MIQHNNTGKTGARPRVLISGSFASASASEQLNDALQGLANNVLSSFEGAGIDGELVNAASPEGKNADALLTSFDGLVILGGGDIDPEFYSEGCESSCTYGVNPVADQFEIGLVQAAVELKIPVLGICRGMQVINVALGGTLFEHIGDDTIHKIKGSSTEMNQHPVFISEGSLLHNIFNRTTMTIRSAHHQAVKELGKGLVISATADDGIVEAIESHDGWCLGVQWHPEDALADQEQIQTLMSQFARACSNN